MIGPQGGGASTFFVQPCEDTQPVKRPGLLPELSP